MKHPEETLTYLISKGWRLIDTKRSRGGYTQYWTHPEHQPDLHGFFTRTSAFEHQRMLDKNGGVCDCIKENS